MHGTIAVLYDQCEKLLSDLDERIYSAESIKPSRRPSHNARLILRA
jgi:hypothetical protein